MSEWVRALDWQPGGPWLESRCGNLIRFGTLAIPFTPLGQCLSEETLKVRGPFYWADMPPDTDCPLPDTDCPYPIRILAFFEMIRPYHVVIPI